MAEVENIQSSVAGVASIKPEFLLQDHVRQVDLNYVAAKDQNKISHDNEKSSDEPPRKKLKGQNKKRPRTKIAPKSEKLCFKIGADGFCPFGDSCCYSHDVKLYLEKKLPDIDKTCYLYETFGKCPYSFSCRFGSEHIKESENLVKDELCEISRNKKFYRNNLNKDVQKSLRRRDYDFKKSIDAMSRFYDSYKNPSTNITNSSESTHVENKPNSVVASEVNSETISLVEIDKIVPCIEVVDNGSSFLLSESKKIDFTDKLFLAPLTTVGNLPFRRVCKEFGADITCSEMAVALSLLQGQQSEWALLKRHHTEDIFGIQLCGPHPDVMTRCSQLLSETISFDFIDLNLGCPLDAIYKMGAGCGLMNRMKKLHGMVYGITSVIDVPLTIKMRTGINGNDNLAYNVIKKIHQWGDKVSLITLHGRSRDQRYTKSADWDYINRCTSIASPISLFGNGDILSYEDYNMRKSENNVAGTMIARGALIKPWIFKEIKEQKHWDISSSERFDILKNFRNYGLEHWGSDTEGVEKTRRFLLEWLSFLYRYIPVGILERIPQRINERPPPYFGRNDLETLMASPSCSDWIKISEMLLGPVPESFVFLPKHKANAYK